jgi:hypothetical protein
MYLIDEEVEVGVQHCKMYDILSVISINTTADNIFLFLIALHHKVPPTPYLHNTATPVSITTYTSVSLLDLDYYTATS